MAQGGLMKDARSMRTVDKDRDASRPANLRDLRYRQTQSRRTRDLVDEEQRRTITQRRFNAL